MPHLLIAFEDDSQTDVPAIVCEDAGFTCDRASAAEAVGKVRAARYDLVLLVAAAPLPVATAVHATAPDLPMVAIAPDQPADVLRALQDRGVRQVVVRPYSIQALRRALADAVGPQERRTPT